MLEKYCSRFSLYTFLAVVSLTGPVLAAGPHSGGHGHSVGEAGDPAKASRTIDIVMIDNAFEPAAVSVRRGETVRFVVFNNGELVHEFNIGTMTMHADHQQEMMVMMDRGILEADRINRHLMKADAGHASAMRHDDPNSVLLEPGDSAEIVWTFSTEAELQMACNVPGQYEAGMFGHIQIN